MDPARWSAAVSRRPGGARRHREGAAGGSGGGGTPKSADRRPRGWLRDIHGHAGREDSGEACSCEVLLASEARYAALFKYTRDGVIVLDRAGIIILANPAAKTILGRRDQALRGTALRKLIVGRERDGLMARIESLLGAGEPPREMDLVRTDGWRLPVEAAAARLPGGNIVLTLRDLTRRREMELARAEGEKLRAVGRLAAGVAHELRNPLFVISNLLHALRDEMSDTPEEVLQDLEMALEESRRARGIIDNLLGFVRPADGEGCRLEPDPVIHQVLTVFRAALDQRNIKLKLDLRESRPCLFNPDAFKQVLINLLTNALDAMPDGGRLTIATAPSSTGGVEVSVRDTGCGMSYRQRKELFTPFYSTKTGGQGNGLGLWIVHRTLTRYGARVRVESTKGRGTKFRMELAVPGGVHEETASEKRPHPAGG